MKNSVLEAKDLINNLNSLMKFQFCTKLLIRATSFNDEYYNANMIKSKVSSSEEILMSANQVLYGILMKNEDPKWKVFDANHNYTFYLTGFNF